ncbi:MAG: hypothetical protein KGJ59_11510 [Bacteroidota bacterium]|nr:hypothetical protein [Bacteroidota bacterium]
MITLALLSLSLSYAQGTFGQTPKKDSPLMPIGYKSKAILLGDDIVPYDDSGRVVTGLKVREGEIVDICAKTKKNYSKKDPDQFNWTKYPFVKIKYGEIGLWVSGKFAFTFDESKPAWSVQMDKNRVNIFLGKNFGVGTTNEEGMTDDDMLFYPLILGTPNDSASYCLIPVHTEPFNRGQSLLIVAKDTVYVTWNHFFALMDNGYADEKIRNVEATNSDIIFHVTAEYMEGSATYDLIVPFYQKASTARVQHYLREEE